MNFKNKENRITPERIKNIEDYCHVKFVIPNSLIILHNYTLWRPALSDEEVTKALHDKVPTLSMSSELVYVPLLWSYNY